MKIEHFFFYIANTEDKKELISKIKSGKIINELVNLKGVLFSEFTLNKFIEEEILHDHFGIIEGTKKSFQHYSEGEKRKVLLSYLISTENDYIILDNLFDYLDAKSQVEITETLTKISANKIIVQIANRKRDALHFIKNKYSIKGNSIILDKEITQFKEDHYLVHPIPAPYSILSTEINPLVKFNNVTVKYKERTIVKNIDWEIKTNEFWQLKGPNGSGKSTLLSLITGENPKAYGQDIILFGVQKGSGESIWDIRKNIGFISSVPMQGFSRSQTIEKMILSGFFDSFGLYQEPTSIQKKIAADWLLLLNFLDLKDESFFYLSAGHQKLVLIARAMVKHPPLLILDEPTAGLDDSDVVLITNLINKISLESTTSILYVSHRKEEGLNPKYIYELIPSETGSIGDKVVL
jgi:molybdate transport system ATP-binding protein